MHPERSRGNPTKFNFDESDHVGGIARSNVHELKDGNGDTDVDIDFACTNTTSGVVGTPARGDTEPGSIETEMGYEDLKPASDGGENLNRNNNMDNNSGDEKKKGIRFNTNTYCDDGTYERLKGEESNENENENETDAEHEMNSGDVHEIVESAEQIGVRGGLLLVQCNLNGLSAESFMKKKVLMEATNGDIICLNETHLGVDETLQLDGYRTYQRHREMVNQDASRKGGGVMICVKNDMYKMNGMCMR